MLSGILRSVCCQHHKLIKNINFQIIRNFKTNYIKMPSVLALLPAGAEEMELVISVDVLRRGGINVTVAGLDDIKPVICSRNVVIVPDVNLIDVAKDEFDCVLLPGGLGGSKIMGESKLVGEILGKQEKSGKLIAAICAAPTVLSKHSICLGKTLTSYPSVKSELVDKYKYDDENIVVHDNNLLTSRGPGTAFQFALKLVEILVGSTKSEEVAKGMLLK